MAKASTRAEDLQELRSEILEMQFPRLITFADVVTRYLDTRLSAKLSWLNMHVMTLLVIRGGDEATLNLTELARHMLRSRHSMTRLVDVLEEGGLVKRVRTSKDRRTVNVKMTPAGLALLNKHVRDMELAEKEVLSNLEDREIAALREVIPKLRRRLVYELSGQKGVEQE